MKKLLAFLCLLPTLCRAECTINGIINSIRPNASYTLTSGTYDGIVWTDLVQTIPTRAEFNAAVQACTQNQFPTSQDLRNQSILLLTSDLGADRKLLRAILMVLFDENNNTREWIQAFKGQVALATSLADLKTRIATLPDMPDRTVQQAQTAVQNKINSGASD